VTYDVLTHERLFIVYWRRVPAESELDHLVALIRDRRDAVRSQLFYVAIIPAEIDVPEGMQRHTLAKFGERAGPYVASAHLVLEGNGFKHALQRSVITAIYTLRGGPTKVFTHANIDDTAARLATLLDQRVEPIRRVLGAARQNTRPEASA
jgi:hypothetical protein